MEKTLFRDTRKKLEEVYKIVEEGKIDILKDLSGKELQAYYYVMDLCQAIFEIEKDNS